MYNKDLQLHFWGYICIISKRCVSTLFTAFLDQTDCVLLEIPHKLFNLLHKLKYSFFLWDERSFQASWCYQKNRKTHCVIKDIWTNQECFSAAWALNNWKETNYLQFYSCCLMNACVKMGRGKIRGNWEAIFS